MMENQSKFIEMIEDLTTLARLNNREVTPEFLEDYLKELKLEESQMQLVYDYLAGKGIRVTGVAPRERSVVSSEPDPVISDRQQEESEFLETYVREVGAIPKLSLTMELVSQAVAGDETARNQMIHACLPRVVELAGEYQGRGVSKSDLIQEGNVGLLMAMYELEGIGSLEEARNVLEQGVRRAMLDAIDELEDNQRTNRHLIRKADLVREKAEELSETMNDKMTVEEIASYMDMDPQEIQDILRLTGEEGQ